MVEDQSGPQPHTHRQPHLGAQNAGGIDTNIVGQTPKSVPSARPFSGVGSASTKPKPCIRFGPLREEEDLEQFFAESRRLLTERKWGNISNAQKLLVTTERRVLAGFRPWPKYFSLEEQKIVQSTYDVQATPGSSSSHAAQTTDRVVGAVTDPNGTCATLAVPKASGRGC